MTTAAIILAAGRGRRAGGALPKQWQDLRGQTICAHSLHRFANHPLIDQVILVVHPDDLDTKPWPETAAQIVVGGDSRAQSVQAGLDAVSGTCDRVLIHDGARPLVSDALIDRVVTALDTHSGAAPGIPVVDALWTVDDDQVSGFQDRAGLMRAQTPQGFHTDAIIAAHRAYDAEPLDDVQVARAAGMDVAVVAGEEQNLKVTLPADFDRAARMMDQPQMTHPIDIRTGNGFDVHRFGPGDHVTLCGIAIPHERGLQGHSDADVGMHTVTDAIYGALARGDIGQHFPPTDPQWKGAASHIFLEHACTLARDMGFTITHIDCTLICEYPKIGPHAETMRAEMARIMGLDVDRVSVKATTSERLGFTGRGEGIAAMATATLVKS